MSTPIALTAIPSWQQSQPSPPPPVSPSVQPVAAGGESNSADTNAGSQGGATYTPARQNETPQLYARPAAQGTINTGPDSGTAAADVAVVNAAPEPAGSASKTPAYVAASAAYAMVADSPGTMPSSVLHPLQGA